jgi:WD repeat-containing protein 19
MKKLFRVGPESQGGNDSSKQPVEFAWQGQGNFLASVASNGVVRVLDRHGEMVPDGEVVLKGQGQVLALAWDASGEILAVLQEGNGIIELWDLKSRRATGLDTNLKDPSFIKWASAGPELAVGTAKGNLLLYNSDTRRKVGDDTRNRRFHGDNYAIAKGLLATDSL